MSTYLAVAAATWGVAMSFAPLLQIRAVRAHGTSQAVSVGYQQILLVGFVLWLAYGIAIEQRAADDHEHRLRRGLRRDLVVPRFRRA